MRLAGVNVVEKTGISPTREKPADKMQVMSTSLSANPTGPGFSGWVAPPWKDPDAKGLEQPVGRR